MTTGIRLSIIIINMNGDKWIDQLMKSIHTSAFPLNECEIIFVDNNSSDSSLDLFRKSKLPNISYIEIVNNVNVGWSPAVNQGILRASGSIVIILSNDMEIDKFALGKIDHIFREYSDVGIIQFCSLSLTDRVTPDSGLNFLDMFGYSYSYLPSAPLQNVFFAEGMAFAISRDVIDSVGLLDSSYFMEYDDMDYSWRTILYGFRIVHSADAKVYHARGGTVGRTYFERNLLNIELYTKNHFTTLLKNYETMTLMFVIPTTLLIETLKILFLLLRVRIGIAWANIKGIADAFLDMSAIREKRREIQKNRKIMDKDLIKLMNSFQIKDQFGFFSNQSKGKRYFSNGDEKIIVR